MTECKVQIITDNDPQVVIYMPVIMPFRKSDYAYIANSTFRGCVDNESRYDSYVCYPVFIIGGPETFCGHISVTSFYDHVKKFFKILKKKKFFFSIMKSISNSSFTTVHALIQS